MTTKKIIKNLKLEGHNKIPIFPANWITGVDYKEKYKDNNYDNENDEEYVDEKQDYEYDNELEDEQAYNRTDQEEIYELFDELSDVNDNNNANPTNNDNPLAVDINNDGDEVPGKITSASQIGQKKHEVWTYSHKQTTKTIKGQI